METDHPLLERASLALAAVPGVVAIVLGGSRTRDAAHSHSDYDFGLYFSSKEKLDIEGLLEAVRRWSTIPAPRP